MFDPHVQTVPSDFKTMVPLAPPQMDTTSAAGENETSAKTSNIIAVGIRHFIGRRILIWRFFNVSQPCLS
jgi:hypothetical protein